MRTTQDLCVDGGFEAITSLSRAVAAGVRLPDVGSLLWVVLGQMVPCDAMALFMPDETGARVGVRYAAGRHANLLEGISRPTGLGVAGWVGLNRRSVLNAEPIFDLGFRASALRSSVVVPLIDNGEVIAVLALYSKDLLAFTDEHATMLELLGSRLAVTLADAAVVQQNPPVEGRPTLQLAAARPSRPA